MRTVRTARVPSFVAPALGLLALALASPASAKSSYGGVWSGLYPNSLSDDNVVMGTGTSCQLCHSEVNGGDGYNGYGWDMRTFMQGGASISDAILMSEGLDSDADPTGSTNLVEIQSDTQPGWTDGNNNTIYFKDGSTTQNQPPPSGILGSLDPGDCPDDKYCGSSQNPNNVGLIDIDTCDSSSSSINVLLSNAPPNQFVYLLVGNGKNTVSNPPGAKGDLCVVGGSCLGRYDKDVGQIDMAGNFSTDIQNAVSNPCNGGVVIAPGATWNFQFWHRQPMGQPATFSQAMTVVFQ